MNAQRWLKLSCFVVAVLWAEQGVALAQNVLPGSDS
jgi:hypothetical protein